MQGRREDCSAIPTCQRQSRRNLRPSPATVTPSSPRRDDAVKHFKWRPAGKRRLHEKPNRSEIAACRLWLDAEIGILKPQVVVCLGATAAQALIVPSFKVTQQRGRLIRSPLAPHVIATVHPSCGPDDAARGPEMKLFVADLKAVARVIRGLY
jgi:DNA polymerase